MKNKGKPKGLLFAALAVGLSLALSLSALELGVRWSGLGKRSESRPDRHFDNPRGYYAPTGVSEGRTVYGIPYGMDADGTRSQDLDRPPPPPSPGPPGILALGDSFTAGMGLRFDDMYINRLSAMLAAEGIAAGVLNRARVAADIEDIYGSYRRIPDAERFPIVLYGFVLNDFGLPGIDKASGADLIDAFRRESGGLLRKSALYRLIADRMDRRRRTRETIRAYHQAFLPPHADGRFRLFSMLADSVRDKGSTLVVVLFPLLYDFDDYPFAGEHERIRDFCESRGIPFLDLLPAFSRYPAEELWCHPEDFHPNEIANKLAAEEVFAFLKSEGLLDRLPRAGQGER